MRCSSYQFFLHLSKPRIYPHLSDGEFVNYGDELSAARGSSRAG